MTTTDKAVEEADPRETKLPVWAQQELSRLRANLTYWKNAALVGPEYSDTFLQRYGSPNTPLGDHPTITFEVDPSRINDKTDIGKITCRLVDTPRGRYLEVRAPGGDTVEINPDVSNTVRVRPVDWNDRP